MHHEHKYKGIRYCVSDDDKPVVNFREPLYFDTYNFPTKRLGRIHNRVNPIIAIALKHGNLKTRARLIHALIDAALSEDQDIHTPEVTELG